MKIEEAAQTIHIILAGVLMNGFFQVENEKLDSTVLEEADKQILKILKNLNNDQ
jgi:hypothetical protein